jgi:hypothetical protein
MASKAKPAPEGGFYPEKVTIALSPETRGYLIDESARRRKAGRRDWSMASIIADAVQIAFGSKTK